MTMLVCYSTKDRAELTVRTAERLFESIRHENFGPVAVAWFDGSSEHDALALPERFRPTHYFRTPGSNPDSVITAALRFGLGGPYEYICLLENDVLLDPDWIPRLDHIMMLAREEGLTVGAASARAYRDRVLVQRDGYAIMHNTGAGHLLLTRTAAGILLNNYRTAHTTENRAIFAMLGVDITQTWCWGNNQHTLTADWGFDAILARHGLASIAPCPQLAEMIDQPIEPLGLHYLDEPRSDLASMGKLTLYAWRQSAIRRGELKLPQTRLLVHPGGSTVVYAHQLSVLGGRYEGPWGVKWDQGQGPFTYVSLEAGARLAFDAAGVVGVLVATQADSLESLEPDGVFDIRDARSGWAVTSPPFVPSMEARCVTVQIPGDLNMRTIVLEARGRGATFLGVVVSAQPLRAFEFALPTEFYGPRKQPYQQGSTFSL